MPALKPIFFRLVSPLIKIISLNALSKISSQGHIIPLYHCISDSPLTHLKYLYPAKDSEAFIKDIELLLKYFHPVSLHELIQIVNREKDFNKPVFHLTFDDGLSEFETVVAPLLVEKGIPATCFLNSAFMDNKKMFFRFKASILIDQLHRAEAGSETWKGYHEWEKANHPENKYYRKALLEIGYNRQDLLETLAQKLKIDFNVYLKKHKPYMEKNQIVSLIRKGFTFGAHSIDHPEYRFISEEEQIEQTLNSIENITETFGLSYKVFSFPFTDHEVSLNFFNSIQDKVDLTFGCAGIKKDSVPYNLQRIPVEENNESIESVLKKEYLYLNFLKVLQKDRIKRKQ